MPKILNIAVLVFMLFINGCALTALDGVGVNMEDNRKIIVEPKHIEISGDIEISDWKHIKKIHDLVIVK